MPKRRASFSSSYRPRAYRRVSYPRPSARFYSGIGAVAPARARYLGLRTPVRASFAGRSTRTRRGTVGRRTARRRFRPSAGVRNRRRVGRRGSRGGSQRSFNAKLIRANGIKKTFTTHNQCEWKVRAANEIGSITGVITRAQWMWPRQPGVSLASFVLAPEYIRDWNNIILAMFGTTWYVGRAQDIYNHKFMLGYRARYSVTNQTNSPVDYKYYICKWRRDIPRIFGNNTLDYENIFNVAGAYLARLSSPDNLSNADATNDALTFESENMLTYPPVKDLIKVVKTGKFTLAAGDNRAVSISRRTRRINILKMYPPMTPGTVETTPQPNYHWEKGDSFVLFRMFTRPADYNDGTVVAEDALSTRTTPVSLLSYDCKYTAMRMEPLQNMQHVILPSYGLLDDVDETKIQVVADDDIKAVPEARAI